MSYYDSTSTVRQIDDAGREGAGKRRFLVSALLLFVAKGDGSISDIESGRMIDLMATHMKISNAEALSSLSNVVNALQDDEDIARKLREIASSLTSTRKREILSMMLDVAAVDDVRDEGETEAINMARRILGLSSEAIREVSSAVR